MESQLAQLMLVRKPQKSVGQKFVNEIKEYNEFKQTITDILANILGELFGQNQGHPLRVKKETVDRMVQHLAFEAVYHHAVDPSSEPTKKFYIECMTWKVYANLAHDPLFGLMDFVPRVRDNKLVSIELDHKKHHIKRLTKGISDVIEETWPLLVEFGTKFRKRKKQYAQLAKKGIRVKRLTFVESPTGLKFQLRECMLAKHIKSARGQGN